MKEDADSHKPKHNKLLMKATVQYFWVSVEKLYTKESVQGANTAKGAVKVLLRDFLRANPRLQIQGGAALQGLAADGLSEENPKKPSRCTVPATSALSWGNIYSTPPGISIVAETTKSMRFTGEWSQSSHRPLAQCEPGSGETRTRISFLLHIRNGI